MKEVAIFYRDRINQPAIMHLQDNFYNVFGDFINITNYYTNEIPDGKKIVADVYILCYEESLRDLFGHVDDFSRVVIMTRSFRQKYLKPVIDLPAGTGVLVVNDSKESILQTIYMIYELGIGHLRLIPFEKSVAAAHGYDHIDTAIVTHDSEHLVPDFIKNVINIHNREVSFETFHKVMDILGLENTIVRSNLLRKIKEDIDSGERFINSYMSSFLKDRMLNDVADESSLAIVLLDLKNRIHYINEKAYGIFGLDQGQFFPVETVLPEKLSGGDVFDNEIITYKDVNYLAERSNISLLDEPIGFYITFQNENDLRESENKLSRKLRQTGFYARYSFSDIIHCSLAMDSCIRIAKKAASSDYTVLIRGESGTGKELLAQSIHNYSPRKSYRFVAVNCAAIPESLLESELFGYEEGSFTGAHKGGKPGLFENASHGTIFLDEIGDISPNLQTRLLRVIQEKQIMRVGSGKIIDIDTRIIAATNADLEARVAKGDFREDLFYRLNVIPLSIAPLRRRKDDILPLLKVFLGKRFQDLTPSDHAGLLAYNWPGNVRELENAASYYRTMGQLPDYILRAAGVQPSEDIFAERPEAESHDDGAAETDPDDLKITVLKIIAACSSAYSGIGRGKIMEELSARGLSAGEGVLKRCLSELKTSGLIESGSGRGGSHLTEKGAAALEKEKS